MLRLELKEDYRAKLPPQFHQAIDDMAVGFDGLRETVEELNVKALPEDPFQEWRGALFYKGMIIGTIRAS